MASTPANPLTFEDVDKHIESIDLAKLRATSAQTGGAAAIPNVCPVYKAVRPILVLLSTLALLPQKWRDALKALIQVLDVVCP